MWHIYNLTSQKLVSLFLYVEILCFFFVISIEQNANKKIIRPIIHAEYGLMSNAVEARRAP
jgi:hypothetical protein